MEQKFHNFSVWEEFHSSMWKKIHGEERDTLIKKAVEFTGNAELYGSYMMKVLEVWPNSCEQNLTDSSLNRRAWIGQAACCIGIGCPEEITRIAWHYLTLQQQDEANIRADIAIKEWEEKYKNQITKNNQLNLFDYGKK